ncbi:uncharacterized protein LOC114534889 [Dendronephthya gigantea]|uniref:uncharacterized protein LOC114534889 n=1 Tax=Dendronephthya gigantea TaxID=151771 RepID=UPI00106B95CE|nr:uncharacterized protein LOC114534889 [Dendronephthya gigantea]
MISGPQLSLPKQEDIGEIPAGTLFGHCTSKWRWNTASADIDIKRTKGNVNAVGKGFYTYHWQLIEKSDFIFSQFIGWSNVEFSNEDPKTEADFLKIRDDLKQVRIVEVKTTKNVPFWKSKKIVTSADKILSFLSNQGQLNFAAIDVVKPGMEETVWLNAKLINSANNIWRYPVEDSSKFEYLEGNIREMTESEIDRYIHLMKEKKISM